MAKTASRKSDGKQKKASGLEKAIKAIQPDWKITSAEIPAVKPKKGGREITIEDLYAWQLPGNPQVSPDGSRIVYEVLSIDKESDEYRSTLWLIDGDSEPRKLTSGAYSDTSPAWSPDGRKIAFCSNRNDKKAQLFVLPIDGGEAQQITDIKSGVGEFRWSPDSGKIAFLSRIGPEKEDDESDVKVITSAYYKFDGMGFIDGKRSHICIVDAAGGEHTQLTSGDYNHTQITFSPNGYEIAFVSNRNEDWDIRRERDIWTIDINSKALKKLTDGKGRWGSPVFSPDGETIALSGLPNAYSEDVNDYLYLMPAEGGTPERIGVKLDRGIGDSGMSGPTGAGGQAVRWSPDGKAIDALVANLGDTHVVRFPVDGSRPECMTPAGRHVKAFDHYGEDLVIASALPTRPAEISRISAQGEQQLTHHNDEWVAEVRIPQPEEFWVQSGEEVIQGWLIRPKGNTASGKKKVPLILNIHGGPHAQFTHSFFHELQMYVARGFALVFINPRGSTGRSNEFARAVNAKWGFADMPDFVAAIDHVIAMGGIDEKRLGVTGGSYGGFSTNWLLGHTDRFKAAVTDRSISNMASMYGTDDISLVGFDLDLGTPWSDPMKYWEASPLAYVENIKAPLLIIHSEEDYRCPMEQAEQLFMALKSLRRTVEFARFPNESHGLGRNGKPKHRVERLQRTLDWFEKYL